MMDAAVVTRTGESAFRRSFPPQTSSARVLRGALGRYFTDVGIGEADAPALLLCADEALINAVAHAPQAPVLVAAWVRDERFVLEVSDEGPGFDAGRARCHEVPDLEAEHGRGLFLIHQLMDDVRIESGKGGTVVRMELRLPAVTAPQAA